MKFLEMMVGSRGNGGAKEMAEMLRRMGRRGDTMLAHITPEEADMLAEMGGSGTINPETGLPEFFNVTDFDSYDNAFNRIPDADINDIVDQARLDRARSRQPVSAYQETEPDRNIFRQNYSQPRQEVQTIRDFPLDQNFSQDPSIPERRPSVYERLTGVRTGSLNRPDDLMQSSPNPRVYDAATGNRFASQDPFSAAQSGRLYPDVNFGYIPEFRGIQDAAVDRSNEPGFFDRAEGRLKEIEAVLNQYPRLTRAGTAGANILAQALLFNQANRAMKRDIEETRRGAQPFRAAQQEAMGRATGGGLTPEQEQEMEIAQARARQGLGERGMQTGSAASGILAAQARRARSLARQESFGEALRLANIADQYDRRALEMELARDQQLAQLFAGIVGREVQQAQRTEAPAQQQPR
jgi:hypothetical protein